MINCKYINKGICSICSEISKDNFFPSVGFCLKYCEFNKPKRESLIQVIAKIKKPKKDRQKEIAAAVAQLPSKYQMVKNLGKHAITVVNHYLKTGRVKVANDHEQARETICRACDKHKIDDNGSLRCTLKSCGCHLTGDLGRLAFEALPCDIDKHDEIDKIYLKGINHGD